MQSTEAQAGSRRPSVSGTSENVQEGIDSAAKTIKAGSRRTEQYAAEPEKVSHVMGHLQRAACDYIIQGNAQSGAYEGTGSCCVALGIFRTALASGDLMNGCKHQMSAFAIRLPSHEASWHLSLNFDALQAVDDAAGAINEGVDQAAEGISEGIDQAREYVEEPTKVVEDATQVRDASCAFKRK